MGSEGGTAHLQPGWNARVALADIHFSEWRGHVWRTRGLNIADALKSGVPVFYEATSDGGSRHRSGRYHRARDVLPSGPVWPVIYTSLSDGTAIGEVLRHAGSVQDLEFMRITRIWVQLSAVLDIRDPTQLGLTVEDVTVDPTGPDDDAYHLTQEIGLAALERRAEGILVPSATRLNANLVILTDNLKPTSIIEAREDYDLKLYVPRP